MKITSAEFLMSSPGIEKCPQPDKPEYAFIGRSNVGKSSLINMICNYSGLAKISARPGKTQLINHFLINKSWFLVDLPGYGFAKVAKTLRTKFDQMISGYITKRENLMCIFVLVDARLEPQQLDRDFMEKLAENGIAFAIVFTKCDKLSATEVQKNIARYKREMLTEWEEFPLYFLTSAADKSGREELLQFIDETNKLFEERL